MLSSKDIADLEKKYLKNTLKRRVKILFYILLLSTFSIFALYFLFFHHADKVKKRQVGIDDKNSTKNIRTIIPKVDINRSKKIVKIKIVKKENNSTDKLSHKNNNDSVQNSQKNLKTSADINISKKILVKTEKKKKNTSFAFKIYPSDTQHLKHTITRKLVFSLATPIKEKTTFSKIETKSTQTVNKNDTIAPKENKKPKINIKMRDIDSIQYLKDKFKKTHDIVFALMLCENYYSQKNFKNSLKWSIIANDIDSQSERSWIWFAKSKYRLHQKNDAIRALKSFLKLNDSQDIKSLLRDIVNGELND